MKEFIDEHIEVVKYLYDLEEKINKAANIIADAIRNANKVLICGNGGSAADSQHIAAELVGRYKKDRAPISAIALTTDTSILTAVANDYSFDVVFERQVAALATKGDVLLGISTSGNSKNVINAINKARELGCYTIGLLGKDGGKIKDIVDLNIVVPSNNTPRIQESHILIGHIICEIVESLLYP